MAISFDDEELFWEAMLSGGYEGEPKPAKTDSVSEPEEEAVSPKEKMRAAMLANEAMKQEEANAETLWNLQGRPTVTPEMAAGFRNEPRQFGQVMPTSRGFMYVGAPPPADDPNAGYDRMKAAGMIQPPSQRLQPTDIAWTPAYDQFAAQQDIKAAVARGVPLVEALAENPAALAGLRAGAQESLARAASPSRVSAATIKRPINISGRGYIWDPTAGTLTPGTPEPTAKPVPQLTPEGAARLLRGATEEELNTKLPNGDTARQYLERIIYGGAAIAKPTVKPPPGVTTTETGTKATPRIGEVIKGYRFKGGNPNDKNSWEKI